MPTTKLDTLQDLLILKLKVLYDVEHELNKFIPKVEKKIKSPELRKAVRKHASEIPDEIKKIEKIFNSLGVKPSKVKSEGIRGIIADAKWMLTISASAEARDAGLIGALQYLEHYEITAYGTASAWAEELGLTSLAKELKKTALEEGEADRKLSAVAEDKVNEVVDDHY